jgi:hypothetical protein
MVTGVLKIDTPGGWLLRKKQMEFGAENSGWVRWPLK